MTRKIVVYRGPNDPRRPPGPSDAAGHIIEKGVATPLYPIKLLKKIGYGFIRVTKKLGTTKGDV